MTYFETITRLKSIGYVDVDTSLEDFFRARGRRSALARGLTEYEAAIEVYSRYLKTKAEIQEAADWLGMPHIVVTHGRTDTETAMARMLESERHFGRWTIFTKTTGIDRVFVFENEVDAVAARMVIA